VYLTRITELRGGVENHTPLFENGDITAPRNPTIASHHHRITGSVIPYTSASSSSLSIPSKAVMEVVYAFNLEHSLSSPPRIMQKSSSTTSSFIVEDGESGQEGNEWISNEAAVDADPHRYREHLQDVARYGAVNLDVLCHRSR